ncbi:hypothetical protein NPIL_150371 [Nephila pilipes]|uniref:Uncharacterized protein n=1 Tax=Nephila pilipes TaxID=299642 RepID=A0A8X6P2X2_NEPPI|nr:hypothetical protein NPIL_150371 [Nephila pilipes]
MLRFLNNWAKKKRNLEQRRRQRHAACAVPRKVPRKARLNLNQALPTPPNVLGKCEQGRAKRKNAKFVVAVRRRRPPAASCLSGFLTRFYPATMAW